MTKTSVSQYLFYKSTLNHDYRGRHIHCCYYKPDILCRIDGQQHGNFFVNTAAAKASAEAFIDRVIKEKSIKGEKV